MTHDPRHAARHTFGGPTNYATSGVIFGRITPRVARFSTRSLEFPAVGRGGRFRPGYSRDPKMDVPTLT